MEPSPLEASRPRRKPRAALDDDDDDDKSPAGGTAAADVPPPPPPPPPLLLLLLLLLLLERPKKRDADADRRVDGASAADEDGEPDNNDSVEEEEPGAPALILPRKQEDAPGAGFGGGSPVGERGVPVAEVPRSARCARPPESVDEALLLRILSLARGGWCQCLLMVTMPISIMVVMRSLKSQILSKD